MWKHAIIISILVFTLGWLSHSAYDATTSIVSATPINQLLNSAEPEEAGKTKSPEQAPKTKVPETLPSRTGFISERASPFDWVRPHNIHVERNKFWVEAPRGYELQWNILADTNSMDPLMDETTNAIQIVPKSPKDVHVGDIISYETEFGIIVHRVVEIGQDEQGWYAITKGDNVPVPDPAKVRFENVRRIVIAVIY